jgi:hypothetical protein
VQESYKLPPRHEKRYHDVFNLTHEITMNTIDTLTLKALELKQTLSGHSDVGGQLIDALIAKNDALPKENLRNICAFISKELFADVEKLCNNLGLSKRRVIEMALIDIIEKANEVMNAYDVFDGIEADGE